MGPELASIEVVLLPVLWPVVHAGDIAESVRELYKYGFSGLESGEVESSLPFFFLCEFHDEVGYGFVELFYQLLVGGIRVLDGVM